MYRVWHSSSWNPAGKQAQNPNKANQTRGKNLAHDQCQWQAPGLVCKQAQWDKTQLVDFVNGCPLPIGSQTQFHYVKFLVFAMGLLPTPAAENKGQV